ncbi:MAG: CHAT domain-containing protein [Acidimicrobiia bacterium]|nr:CHAT domain-containing protein [Acidimicrobiia bacterium]
MATQSIAERAVEVLSLADANPPEAFAVATALAAEATDAGDVHGEAMALRALGLAARNIDEIDRSVDALERGVALARSLDDIELVAQIQTTLGPTLLYAGRSEDAISVLRSAIAALEGVDRAKALSQLGGVMARMTRFPEAASLLEQAVQEIEAAGDDEWLAHVLTNLGLVHAYSGDTRKAERNTLRAQALYHRLGHDSSVGILTHNLGFIAMRDGRVGEALQHFRTAEDALSELGQALGELLTDHCEALMLAGLYTDAMAVAQRCVGVMRDSNMEVGLAEARLMLSHAAFLAGEYETARLAAAEAQGSFIEQERPGWAAHAEFSGLRAAASLGAAVDQRHAMDVADRLEAGQMRLASLAARVIAGRIALDHGNTEVARSALESAAAARRSRRLDLRVNAWTAEAMLRRAENDSRGTLSALRSGMRAVEDLGGSLGSTDARLGVQAMATELMDLALDVNLDRGPQAASEWIERIALRDLDFRPVSPDPVPELEEALARLRDAASELRSAELESSSVASLQAEVTRQVASIRRVRIGTDDLGDSKEVLRRAQLRLADGALVQWGISGDRIVAVVTTSRRRRVVECGSSALVTDRLDWLRFQLLRVARHATDSSRSDEAADAAQVAAAELSAVLLAPLRIAEESVVLAPPRSLLGVPWNLMPGLLDASVSVVPSVRSWLRATLAPPRSIPALVVAGPDLDGAEDEVDALRRVLPDPSLLNGRAASVTGVKSSLDGTGTAHLIAHGSVAPENPMLSSLRLADGPLMLYDLEDLANPPSTVVLSACDSGRVATGKLAGVGIATALLGLGVRSVVASTTVIPDSAATKDLMVRLHSEMRELPAAEALRKAYESLDEGPESLLLRGFVAFGA